jgi:hypothetical protein
MPELPRVPLGGSATARPRRPPNRGTKPAWRQIRQERSLPSLEGARTSAYHRADWAALGPEPPRRHTAILAAQCFGGFLQPVRLPRDGAGWLKSAATCSPASARPTAPPCGAGPSSQSRHDAAAGAAPVSPRRCLSAGRARCKIVLPTGRTATRSRCEASRRALADRGSSFRVWSRALWIACSFGVSDVV